MAKTGPWTAPTEFICLLDNEHEAPLAKYQYETNMLSSYCRASLVESYPNTWNNQTNLQIYNFVRVDYIIIFDQNSAEFMKSSLG